MNEALHIIDRTTPRSLLDQLSLLAGREDEIVSVGPAPRSWHAPRPVRQVHAPLDRPGLCGRRMGKLAKPSMLIHAWSHRAALAGEIAARGHETGLAWSLAHVPHRQAVRDIRRVGRSLDLRVTVPTIACRQALVDAAVPEESISVLPPAAAAIADGPLRRQRARRLLGLNDRRRLILAPAEMTHDGGHKLACWVFAILRQLRDDLCLLLPGSGPAWPYVRSFAQATGYQSEIFLTEGRIELSDCLAAADVAVLFANRDPNLYALAGAMAAGLPIAASAGAGVCEIAPHDQAALLVPPGDPRSASAAVLKLLEDADVSARLSAQARRTAEQFDPNRVRGQLQGIYAALRARGSPLQSPGGDIHLPAAHG